MAELFNLSEALIDVHLAAGRGDRPALRYEGVTTRFDNAAAIVGPSEGSGLSFPSGVTVYRLRSGHIDDGTFVPLGAP